MLASFSTFVVPLIQKTTLIPDCSPLYPPLKYCNVVRAAHYPPRICSYYFNFKKKKTNKLFVSFPCYFVILMLEIRLKNLRTFIKLSIYQIHFFFKQQNVCTNTIIVWYLQHSDNHFSLTLLCPPFFGTRNWTPYRPAFARSDVKVNSVRRAAPLGFSKITLLVICWSISSFI